MAMPLKDITGKRYGKLVVIKRNGSLGKNSAWECLCKCGNKHTVSKSNLISGNVISCGCAIIEANKNRAGQKIKIDDIVNKSFGKLRVLRLASSTQLKRGGYRYKYMCECSCGNIVTVPRNKLIRSKQTSCGCDGKTRGGKFDLLLKKHGRLLPILPAGIGGTGYSSWLCRCECGTIKTIRADHIANGKTTSCGCIVSPDKAGQRYGMLTVISRVDTALNRSVWHCICDCGNETDIDSSALSKAKSCGCLRRHADGVAAANLVLVRYKASAKKRKLEFKLTKKEFFALTKGDCYYCDSPPSLVSGGKYATGTYTYQGIDRKNNSLGYTVENCVPCCERCNRAKLTMSDYDFIEHARAIVRKHGNA